MWILEISSNLTAVPVKNGEMVGPVFYVYIISFLVVK